VTLDVSVLHDAALAALRTCTNLDVMDGSVDDAGENAPGVDPDGRSHMYAVLYFSPGWLTSDRAVGVPSILAGSFQVTCAGGDVHRALTAASKVRAALTGARLSASSGLVSESTDPGSVREDPSVAPSRWYVPILFDVFNV
jgi:hypothetical protein